ncbi:MAG: hypothetical protein EBQ75_00080 [Actinobacteria bacterium]|nr:hypothetical protein [Actinomycetota bacterium]
MQTYEEAKRIFAGDPVTLSLLTPENIPSQYKVVPLTDDPALVRSLPSSIARSRASRTLHLPRMSSKSSPRCLASCAPSPS